MSISKKEITFGLNIREAILVPPISLGEIVLFAPAFFNLPAARFSIARDTIYKSLFICLAVKTV